MKVEKPAITPVELDRTGVSGFGMEFLRQETPEIEPQFVDYKQLLKSKRIAPKLNLKAVYQPDSRLFRLIYIFDMGKTSDPRLGIASGYLPFLGTDQYSPRALQQAFYRLGVHRGNICYLVHFLVHTS